MLAGHGEMRKKYLSVLSVRGIGRARVHTHTHTHTSPHYSTHLANARYVFGHEADRNKEENEVGHLMGGYWTSLAIHGDPNHAPGTPPMWPT